MISRLAPALAVLLVAATAHAESTKPGTPIIDSPQSGQSFAPGARVKVEWHMPDGFAPPAAYQVQVRLKAEDGTSSVAKSDATSGLGSSLEPFALEPGSYELQLTAVNAAGRTEAPLVAFRVSEVLVPSPGFTGTIGRPAGPTMAPGGGDAAAGKAQDAVRAPTPTGSSSSDGTKLVPPSRSDERSPIATTEKAPTTPEAVEGSVKPTAAGAGVATVTEEERRTVRGRIVIVPRAKLDLAKAVARVDGVVAKLDDEAKRIEAGFDPVAPAPVSGEFDVWVVTTPKAPKKKGAAAEPVRRFKLSFENPSEAAQLRNQTGAKIAVSGLARAFEGKAPSGEASELLMTRVVFLVPVR